MNMVRFINPFDYCTGIFTERKSTFTMNAITAKLKNFIIGFFFPIVLLLILLLAYALFLYKMGFYWDDWQAVYLFQFKSPLLYWQYFLSDRPISAWTFIIFQPLLGTQAWSWQLATLFSRWLGIWLLCAAFWRIWPSQKRILQWAGLLLAVYPGFAQQNIAVAYHQHFTTFAIFAASFYCMVRGLQSLKAAWRWHIPAVALALLHMLTMEYFAGLEGLRPFLIYFILLAAQPALSFKSRFLKTLKLWLPYGFALLGFAVFRFIVYPAISPDPQMNTPTVLINMLSQPLRATLHLLELAIQDISHMTLQVWLNALQPDAFQLTNKIVLFSWAVALLAGAGVFLFSKLFANNDTAAEPTTDSRQVALTGLLAILLGGLPVWMTDRQSIVGLWSDRFTLAPMIGVAVLLAALIGWFIQQERKRDLLFAILLLISIPVHIQTANKYRLNTEVQQDFYQQLAWRAPVIKPGTAFAASGLPFSYVGDYAVGFSINTLYGMSDGQAALPLWWFNAGRQWGIDATLEMTDDSTIHYDLRNLRYDGTAADLVGLVYNPSRGCLRVLDPLYALAPAMDDYQMEELNDALLTLSHPQQILPSEVDLQFSEAVFGQEEKQSWCYFYEKADLARQVEDWQAISGLYSASISANQQAQHGAELAPFILAAAHQQQWNQALELTRQSAGLTPGMEPMLCTLWQGLPQEELPSAERISTQAAVREFLGCE
jgi:hypothetical protein